eukprot:SAG11_NODE_13305_length_661_cov_0.855872_2_plen_37_part_01
MITRLQSSGQLLDTACAHASLIMIMIMMMIMTHSRST